MFQGVKRPHSSMQQSTVEGDDDIEVQHRHLRPDKQQQQQHHHHHHVLPHSHNADDEGLRVLVWQGREILLDSEEDFYVSNFRDPVTSLCRSFLPSTRPSRFVCFPSDLQHR